jgi:hypothetical protein
MKRLALAMVAGLAVAASAQAANYVSLPSPFAPLSTAPPIGGGASSTSERVRHRIAATTTVDIALDPAGTPFAIHATQRLDVRVVGDYFLTIGAPVLGVEAAPGSASMPGLRSSSILWAGFNPGHRTLIARTTLDPVAARQSLPVRVEVAAGQVTVVNETGVTVGSYTAEALATPLRRYLAQLKRQVTLGASPTSGGAYVTSKPVSTRVRVVVPLRVTGTIGGHAVNALVEDRRLTVHARGAVRLTVSPEPPEQLLDEPTLGVPGRTLLERATRTALMLARARQYEMYLGNPDPTGPNQTTYVYRSAARPAPPPVAVVPVPRRNWARTIAIAAGLILAAAAASFAWSRS